MGAVGEKIPVLDLKPLSYNPFTDGTVVYDNTGGVLVPRSAGGMVDPLGSNPLLEARPSNASTQALIDSAQSVSRSGVKANAAALRGYQTTSDFFDTQAFGRAVDNLSDAELNDFIDGVKTQSSRAAAEAAAVAPRKAAQQALRRGAQFAGALGCAIDAYNVADAILDPTNNPADEIGDVAGSMIGGALGSGLGPLGTVGGALLGGWIGRQLGNLLQGEPGADVLRPGEPPFRGGQCAGVSYVVTINRLSANYPGNGCVSPAYGIQWGVIGPVQGYIISGEGNNTVWQFVANGQMISQLSGAFPNICPGQAFEIVSVVRPDGQPDSCGDPAGIPIPTTTAPTYSPTVLDTPFRPNLKPIEPLPGPTGAPLPGPIGDPLPAPIGDPLPTPTGNPLPAPIGGPSLDPPTSPDDLPLPEPPAVPPPPINPNPDLSCCDRTTLTLEKLLHEVESLKAQFQVSGFATLNMPDCEATTPYLRPWNGSGLTGIYAALETLSEATNRLWDQVKCPPDTTAAAPMAWDIKVHEHPQLIVLWGPAEGGTSRWAMHIPHPKANIGSDYAFAFPQYTKGPVRGTLILRDNSRVVVNGASEAECKKVFAYIRGLIIANYLSGAQEAFTKGTAKFTTRAVRAVYIKAFAGHRDQAPLWTKKI